MPAPVRCRCGALLVEEISDEGVTPLGGEPVSFRRSTDFVICPECFSVYRAEVLLGRRDRKSVV